MWIHVPGISSASARDTAALSSDSTQPWVEEVARSVTWKTKPVSLRSLQRVWKKEPSIRLLSGLTSPPLTLSRGVEEWISSLEDSPVSHGVWQEQRKELVTLGGTCGPQSNGSQPDLDTQTSFWKTSPASSDTTGKRSDQAYREWATPLRKDSSRRQKLGLLIRDNGSSFWPTVTQDSVTMRKKKYAQGGMPLSMKAVNWRTPTSQESGIKVEKLEGKLGSRMYDKKTGRNAQYGLVQQAANWPTPNASEHKYRLRGNTQQSTGLTTTARKFSVHSIPPAQTTSKDGHTCSISCRRLNPLFAEMLMGLPQGWTDDSVPLEMESFQLWQQSLTSTLQKYYNREEKEMNDPETCPECEGSNLNEDHTECWDCSAADYREGVI